MKKINHAYWIITGLYCAFMIFSSYDNAFVGEQSIQFLHTYMGFPVDFIPWLSWATIMGVIAILLHMVPALVKEWAYFGLYFDLASAIYAFIALGADAGGYAFMVVLIAALITSY